MLRPHCPICIAKALDVQERIIHVFPDDGILLLLPLGYSIQPLSDICTYDISWKDTTNLTWVLEKCNASLFLRPAHVTIDKSSTWIDAQLTILCSEKSKIRRWWQQTNVCPFGIQIEFRNQTNLRLNNRRFQRFQISKCAQLWAWMIRHATMSCGKSVFFQWKSVSIRILLLCMVV